jgi:hypothetical protein
MKRVLVVLLIGLIGCGGITFQSNTLGANAVSVSGFVSLVQFTAISDGNGTMINVTLVTLVQTGVPQTFTFCGSQNGMFPLNQNMQVSFMPATTCGNIVAVVHL